MKLYLVQHAKAASKETDPERPLTKEGLQDIQKIAEFIKPLNLCVDYLWHSGKKRAVQTADALAEVIRINKGKTARDGLDPNDNVTALMNDLSSTGKDIGTTAGPSPRQVMIVGHMPFLSKLASLLLAGSESADIAAFKNACIVCLNCSDEKPWQLEWMVIPELLT